MNVLPSKDPSTSHPVATAWRPVFEEIVEALRAGDFALSSVNGVGPLDNKTKNQIENYLRDYGETLDLLPEATWDTSVAQWTGAGWEILVDLWTVESGESDLVISARVLEEDPDVRIVVDSVHVP